MKVASDFHPHFPVRWIIMILGWALFGVGGFLVLLAPLEMITYPYFNPGGKFHYEGFQVGSLMYMVITAQIVVYYLVGFGCLVLAHGHLRRRLWVGNIALAVAYALWIIGLPLVVAAFFVLAGAKEMTIAGGIFAGAALVSGYVFIPAMMIAFYKSPTVRLALKPSRNPSLDNLPVPLLTLAILDLVFIVVFNLLAVCNGIFPFFGTWLSASTGVIALTICIALTLIQGYGLIFRHSWAWWLRLIFTASLGLSCIVTCLTTTYRQILVAMNFPAAEIQMIGSIPAEGWHFALLLGLPFILTVVMIFRARSAFFHS